MKDHRERTSQCASYVRKQKTDKRDAAHILKLVVEGRFPPSGAHTPSRRIVVS